MGRALRMRQVQLLAARNWWIGPCSCCRAILCGAGLWLRSPGKCGFRLCISPKFSGRSKDCLFITTNCDSAWRAHWISWEATTIRLLSLSILASPVTATSARHSASFTDAPPRNSNALRSIANLPAPSKSLKILTPLTSASVAYWSHPNFGMGEKSWRKELAQPVIASWTLMSSTSRSAEEQSRSAARTAPWLERRVPLVRQHRVKSSMHKHSCKHSPPSTSLSSGQLHPDEARPSRSLACQSSRRSALVFRYILQSSDVARQPTLQ